MVNSKEGSTKAEHLSVAVSPAGISVSEGASSGGILVRSVNND